MALLAMTPPRRIAVYLSLETEHGRGILRGIAKFFHQRADITVLNFTDPHSYDRAALRRLRLDGIIGAMSVN